MAKPERRKTEGMLSGWVHNGFGSYVAPIPAESHITHSPRSQHPTETR
jgi:hypothetical protein